MPAVLVHHQELSVCPRDHFVGTNLHQVKTLAATRAAGPAIARRQPTLKVAAGPAFDQERGKLSFSVMRVPVTLLCFVGRVPGAILAAILLVAGAALHSKLGRRVEVKQVALGREFAGRLDDGPGG
jgi:hypothetical protein